MNEELPAAVTFDAAVIFVDVSRYTAFVEHFARRGRGGLEQIPELLGGSYGRCFEIIYEHDGEVVFIVGDAILAYWAGETELSVAVRKATACAEAICSQEAARQDSSFEDAAPGLHVGVGAGLVWAGALGGRPYWSLLVGGNAVAQAARAQGRAHRWSYEISPEARQALRETTRTARTASRDARETPSLAPDWLTDFLAPVLRERLWPVGQSEERADPCDARTPQSDFFDRLADIRPVTALYARIAGLEFHEPQALERQHKLCIALQDDLRKHGGPAGRLYFDDKGHVFTAVFGARGSFHRDDPAHAVDAGRTILTTVARFGLSASVGVATGDALFRVVGNARRRQLLVLGPHINRAARLMTAASSEVLCDGATERATRAVFAYERRGSFRLEGLGDSAAVFRPVERRASGQLHGPPVGRAQELAALTSALSEASTGASGLVVVLGEPGIGKTTLVQAFAETLKGAHAVVSVAPVERGDSRASLLPWRRAIAALLKLDSDAEGGEVLAAVASRVGHQPALLGRLGLLDDILGVRIPQDEGVRHLVGAHRADATMRLIGDLIEALAPRPLAIILDNSQWLDSASWRLVEWAVASVTSLLVIVCVRSGEEPVELRTISRKLEGAAKGGDGPLADMRPRFCRTVDLGELDAGSLAGVIAGSLGEAQVDDALAARIALLSAGNPLFAEEIALTLKGRALIVVRDGFWRSIRPLEAFRFFEGVERVIRERIDRLEDQAQTILRAAAVIGRSFAMDSLAALMDGVQPPEGVAITVESLTNARLIRPGQSSGQFEFRHDQIRDVVYNSTPSDLRRRLHGTLAAWMERGHENASVGKIAVLAQHFEASGDAENAVRYADLAATKALQLGAYREVKAFISICLSQESRRRVPSLSQQLQAIRWRRQLGEALYNLGDLDAQAACIQEALALAGEPVPRSPPAVTARLIVGAARLIVQQIVPAAPRRQDQSMTRAWELEFTRCLSLAAIVDYFEQRFARSFFHTVIAAVHGERTGASVERATAHSQLACALGIIGFRRAALHFMDRAEQTAAALGDPAVHASICVFDALWRMGRCEWETIDRRLEQAQALCEAAGDQLSWCNVYVLRFWALYYRGDFTALEHTAHLLLAAAESSGNRQQETWALRCKAISLIHLGSAREAAEILRVNVEARPTLADLSERIMSVGVLALAYSRLGLHAESIEWAVETLRLLDDIGRPTVHGMLFGVVGAVEVFVRGRESGLALKYEGWRKWERRMLRHLDRFRKGFPIAESQYEFWMGVAAWQDGQRQRAMARWKNALAIAQRRSLGQDVALISAEIRRRQFEPEPRAKS